MGNGYSGNSESVSIKWMKASHSDLSGVGAKCEFVISLYTFYSDRVALDDTIPVLWRGRDPGHEDSAGISSYHGHVAWRFTWLYRKYLKIASVGLLADNAYRE